ncbi:hypothetical protein F967_01012, partial [Acinetobacter sp. CIP 102637]
MRLWMLVHGDIRHLEIESFELSQRVAVHGDIRHLEMIV